MEADVRGRRAGFEGLLRGVSGMVVTEANHPERLQSLMSCRALGTLTNVSTMLPRLRPAT